MKDPTGRRTGLKRVLMGLGVAAAIAAAVTTDLIRPVSRSPFAAMLRQVKRV